jgi:hypothetical protein
VYRLFKLKRKIKGLAIAYTSYRQSKRKEASEFISKCVSYFVARCAVFEIQQEKKKQRMLEKIKKRLAVLVIGANWRKLKLSYRGMKAKIGRYKRRLEVSSRRKALFDRYSTVSPKNFSDPSPPLNERLRPGITVLVSDAYKTEGDLAAPQADMRVKEGNQLLEIKSDKQEVGLASSRIDSEEARLEALIHHEHRQQMKMLKIAHNIPDYSEKLPLPLLQERALMNSLYSIESNALRSSGRVLSVSLTASVRAKTADKLVNTGPTVRNTLIQAPPRVHSRFRAGSINTVPPISLSVPKDVKVVPSNFRARSIVRSPNEEEPSYMRATCASKGEKREEKVFKSRRKALGKINIKELGLPTFSYEMKLKEPSSSEETKIRRDPWRPSVPTGSSYTPGLDNSFYIPHKFPRTRHTSSRPMSTTAYYPELLSLSNEPARHHPLSVSFRNPSAEFCDLIKEDRPMTSELVRRAWSTKPSTAGSNRRRR